MAWWRYRDNHLDGDKNDHDDNENDKKNITMTIKIKIMLLPDVVEVRRSQQTLFGNPEYNV